VPIHSRIIDLVQLPVSELATEREAGGSARTRDALDIRLPGIRNFRRTRGGLDPDLNLTSNRGTSLALLGRQVSGNL
jgi:hypothetical protein